MRADRDDEGGSLVVREQHRDVLARAGRGEDDRVEAEGVHPFHAGGPAVGVGVDDDLRAAGESPVADGVHVADHEIGPVPGVEDRVGAAVHPDQDGPVLADVGPQRRQVLPVVVAAHDDQDLPVLDLGADVGYPDAVEQQLPVAEHVLHRVRDERLQLDRQPGPRLVHRRRDRRRVVLTALAQQAFTGPDLPTVQAQRDAVVERGEQLGPRLVHQRDTGADDDLGAEVGVPAGNAPGRR